jgi:hypothetical protein
MHARLAHAPLRRSQAPWPLQSDAAQSTPGAAAAETV